MVNKYAAQCSGCGGLVPANTGTLKRTGRRWSVSHETCTPATYVSRRPRNIPRGRCEDAPCCGCCD